MSVADALTLAKTMKKPIVYVSPNYILGTTLDYFTVSIIEASSDIPRPFAAKLTDIVSADSKKVADVPIAGLYQPLDDTYSIDVIHESEYSINTMDVYQKAMNLVNTSTPIIIDMNITDDVLFKDTLSLKVADGHKWYKLPDYNVIVSSFAAAHPINGTDKVYLSIYDVDPRSFLVMYTIVKKKHTIREYIRYRKL